MPNIGLGEWLPDLPALGNPGVTVARNVLPTAAGYSPVKSHEVSTTALDARPRGAIMARDENIIPFQYAGDETKLYRNDENTWIDASKTGGYTTAIEEVWEFVPWKNKVLATNFSNDPQQITMGATTFSDLTTDLRARHITTIRDFVVMANTTDSTDGAVPSRVRWSAFNNEEDWTVSPVTLSDFQDLKIAPVDRIFGGEFGVIFQRESVWRMSFVGAPVVFQFDEVLPGVGLMAPNAAVRDGDTIFFLSNNGFFSLRNGTEAVSIGADKVNDFINEDLDTNHLHRMSTVADPSSNRILWAYPGNGNSGGTPNRIIVYDRPLQRWSLINFETELLWAAGGIAQSLDSMTGVNMDTLDISMDSRQWVGTTLDLAVFNSSFQSGFFSGQNMDAQIRTGEREFNDARRTQLNAFRPIVGGGTVTGRIGSRDQQRENVTWTPIKQLSDTGRFTHRVNARYHRFELNMSGPWDDAQGVQIASIEAKRSARRG